MIEVSLSLAHVFHRDTGTSHFDEHTIVAVEPKSVAAQANLMCGDIIEAVNGEPTASWSPEMLASAMTRGLMCRVKVRRLHSFKPPFILFFYLLSLILVRLSLIHGKLTTYCRYIAG